MYAFLSAERPIFVLLNCILLVFWGLCCISHVCSLEFSVGCSSVNMKCWKLIETKRKKTLGTEKSRASEILLK